MPKQEKFSKQCKVVLDTNVWISAIFWHGAPNQIFNLFTNRKITVYFSDSTWKEWQITTGRISLKFKQEKTFSRLSQLIKKNSHFHIPKIKVDLCRDPKDNQFLELGISAKVDFLVSGDQDLLSLKKVRGLKIITPKQLLDLLNR
ncbi:putative toxin-antitoxin system toxin component, PIN family [Candidatus Beckwithbacteria bacterium CG22_combo_CG10-13_8_21_14_all_01_47_9]|uniref:Putative toxin-antitoxin system toxin component, PIN family n=1 Tax=Candidatus Beckwithbacteria bacterium CG22_combo_CG10-13_8_21_14_all_01_47_9 TaxID=1974496 RepID=A0A2H0E329_9BACT|nr:MAG: putative toxin-antitoxin system toxin component, PIN family [Candidatus Beckwithbacteria bacterium CG22_combo_CG10-13_8_21_14_all_01_47_9]